MRLRRLLSLVAVVAVAAVAAPATAAPGRGIDVTVATTYGGQLRSFNLYVAPRVPRTVPVPLVIVLHGLFNDPSTVEASSGLDAVADTEDVAVVYPAAYKGSWNAGTCCGDSRAAGVDDVGFLVHVLDLVQQVRPIDRQRVYLAGFSNGGMLALKAECERPDVFAAAVSVSGTLQAPCVGAQPVNALLIHGKRDTTVPYDGTRHSTFLGTAITSAPTTVARLAKRSRCVTTRNYAGKGFQHRVYAGCADATSVELLTIPAMGHRWPDAAHDGVDGGAVAWSFLRAHALPR